MFVRISNSPRDYAWGSVGQISALFGNSSEAREAELWLGTHEGCPARVADGRTLGEVLDEAGVVRPPFLLKVLAAGAPLSLQVHPTTEQAREGFQRENEAGIPVDAPERSYRDPNAKPEIIVAATQMEALCGLRPIEESRALVGAVLSEDARAEQLATRLEQSPETAIGWLLSGDEEVAEVVEAVSGAVQRIAEEDRAAADTVQRLARHYPGDPGIVVGGLLLNRVTLAPDEALFLPAGNIHAYLEGVGIELMGPSDNVLRAGLTQKHIDADELLRIADFTPLAEPGMQRETLPGALRYSPEAPFELRRIHGEHAPSVPDCGILLAVEEATVWTSDGAERLAPGEAAFIDDWSSAVIHATSAWLALAKA